MSMIENLLGYSGRDASETVFADFRKSIILESFDMLYLKYCWFLYSYL